MVLCRLRQSHNWASSHTIPQALHQVTAGPGAHSHCSEHMSPTSSASDTSSLLCRLRRLTRVRRPSSGGTAARRLLCASSRCRLVSRLISGGSVASWQSVMSLQRQASCILSQSRVECSGGGCGGWAHLKRSAGSCRVAAWPAGSLQCPRMPGWISRGRVLVNASACVGSNDTDTD